MNTKFHGSYSCHSRNSLINMCLLILLATLLCARCALMEKAGRALDGSAFAEKQVAVYRSEQTEMRQMRNRAGEDSLLITVSGFPAMKIRGTSPDERGVFTVTSLEYLGSSAHGWNEYRLDLSGTGSLVLGATEATLSIDDGLETVGISAGRIRRYDTRITGTEALANLRNRHERLTALAGWINSPENPLAAPAPLDTRKKFVQYWKPVLFPEITSKKKRPENWQQEGDRRVKAEDVRWNASYTERVFPEDLRPLRDSGTMLRDWEEALDWLIIECAWSRITEALADETVLQKRKK